MAKVYINDVLQTSPIKMTESPNSVSVNFSFPSNTKQKHVIAFVYNNSMYVHAGNALYKWTGSEWENQGLSSSDGLANPSSNNCPFTGVYDNKIYFISKSGTVVKFDGETLTTETNSNSSISSTLSSFTVSDDPWGFVHNGKIHMFSENGTHLTYDNTNGFVDLTSQDSGLNFSKAWYIFSYDGHIFALCDDLSLSDNHQRYLMQYNESTYIWSKVNDNDAANAYYIGTARDSISDLRKDKKCIDEYGYIHIAGTSESYSSQNTYWDGIQILKSDYSGFDSENYNIFGDYIPGDIVDYDGYIWMIMGCKYGSTSVSNWTNRVIRIENTARLQYYNDWSSGYTRKIYKIVSSTVNLPNNQTITFDASGNVVNN